MYSLILFIILKIVNWPIKGVTGTRGGLPKTVLHAFVMAVSVIHSRSPKTDMM